MKKFLIYTLFSFFLIACDDIIEEDISMKTLEVNHPSDEYFSENSTITFLWDDLKEADEFQIQIVKGKFDSVVRFILDSNISINRFEYTFNPGEYEWRLRAKNSVSHTEFITRSFMVDSTNDLTSTTLILLSPIGELSSNTSKTFKWNPIFSATKYIIEIRENSWGNGQTIYKDTLTGSSVFLENVLGSKKYVWGVKGINSESETVYSTAMFEIDTIKPLPPTLIEPENQTGTPKIGPSITFRWNSGVDANRNRDSIYIYSNPSLTNIVANEEVIGEIYTDSLSPGTYYWRVKTIDKVNNKGNFSTDWVFRIL